MTTFTTKSAKSLTHFIKNFNDFKVVVGDHEGVEKNAQTYIPQEEVLVDVMRCIRSENFCVVLRGPTGSGKSALAQYIAMVLKRKYGEISATRTTYSDDTLGVKDIKDGDTATKLSDWIVAAETGGLVCIDEYDKGELCQELFKQVSERSDHIKLPDGRNLVWHPNTIIIFTANTKGSGSDEYSTSVIIDKALKNRLIDIEVNYPEPEVELKMLKNILPPKLYILFANDFVKLANLYRDAKYGTSRDGKVDTSVGAAFSTRTLKLFAESIVLRGSEFSLYKSLKSSYFGNCDEEDINPLTIIAESVFERLHEPLNTYLATKSRVLSEEEKDDSTLVLLNAVQIAGYNEDTGMYFCSSDPDFEIPGEPLNTRLTLSVYQLGDKFWCTDGTYVVWSNPSFFSGWVIQKPKVIKATEKEAKGYKFLNGFVLDEYGFHLSPY